MCNENENLDLGRKLTHADILDNNTYPLDDTDSGHALCYLCQEERQFRIDGLPPLTTSSGVFSSRIRCDMDAPVYLCLEHLPFRQRQFEAFSPEVEAALVEKQQARRNAPPVQQA